LIQTRLVAAMQIAGRKASAHRSYRVWMRRRSLRQTCSRSCGLSVGHPAIGMLDASVVKRWDPGGDASPGERGAEPVGIIASVAEQGFGPGRRG
jgi:hypothetical protein